MGELTGNAPSISDALRPLCRPTPQPSRGLCQHGRPINLNDSIALLLLAAAAAAAKSLLMPAENTSQQDGDVATPL